MRKFLLIPFALCALTALVAWALPPDCGGDDSTATIVAIGCGFDALVCLAIYLFWNPIVRLM